MGQIIRIKLTTEQREALDAIVARPSEAAGLVRRARVLLLSDAGLSGREIARRLDLTPEHVSKLRSRFRDEGVAGIVERPKPGRTDHAVPSELVERVVQLPPPAGRSRWTTRLLGKTVGLTSGCISALLREHGLKPHLVRTYKVSRDPAFVEKVQDVVGLYLNPPEHAVVLSVDEKTSIRARAHAPAAAASHRPSDAAHARLQWNSKVTSIAIGNGRHLGPRNPGYVFVQSASAPIPIPCSSSR